MSARGFTLLEVLVALAILGIAVVASIQGFSQGLRLLKLSGDHQEAMMIADAKVREAVTPEEGREEGDESRFHWVRDVTKVPAPELDIDNRVSPWNVYQIDVHVHWDARREVHLVTLRTVLAVPPGAATTPAAPGQPAQPGQPATQVPQPAPPTTGSPGTPATRPPSPRTPAGSTR
jgi:general secretion pathway protein I